MCPLFNKQSALSSVHSHALQFCSLLDLRDVVYSRPKAETKQTMRLDTREVICLIISLLNTFYRF